MSSHSRKSLWIGCAVVAVALACLLYWHRTWRTELEPEMAQVHRALASVDAVALLSADLRGLAGIGFEAVEQSLAEIRTHVNARAISAVDWSSATHLAAALYPGSEGELNFVAVLLGTFDPPAAEQQLRAAGQLRVERTILAGEDVLFVALSTPDQCEIEAPWVLQLRSDRIAIGTRAAVESFLARAGGANAGDPVGIAFDRFSSRRVVSLELRARPPGERAHPLLPALFAAVQILGGSSQELRLGLQPRLTGGALLELEADAADAAEVVAAWEPRRNSLGRDWSRIAPTLGALGDALELEAQSGHIYARVGVSAEHLAAWTRLPDELLVLSTRAYGSSRRGQTEIDPRPREFRAHYPLSALPRFDPERPLAGQVDAADGPFGVRLSGVRRGEHGLELEVEAIGPTLANLGEGRPGPQLEVASVRGSDGRELLRDEPCGVDRNGVAVSLARDLSGDWMNAAKTVRLVDDAALDQVDEIRARIRLVHPVRIEVQTIEEIAAGARAEWAEGAVEITGGGSDWFSYRSSGDRGRILDVRGVDAMGRPVPVLRSWGQDLWIDAGRTGSRSFISKIDFVQAVFASEDDEQQFELVIGSGRPGSDRVELASESARFIAYSPKQYEEEFGPRVGVAFDPDPVAHALTTAGPFTVAHRKGAGLEVLAPDIPNLTYNLGGLELLLDGVRRPLLPRYRFGREGLRATVSWAEEAARDKVVGELVLRLPLEVSRVEIPALEPGKSAAADGVRLSILELRRDRIDALIQGDASRLISVRAFDAEGQELRVEPGSISRAAAGLRRSFVVSGRASALQILFAKDVKRLVYPFRLSIPSALPANTASE